MSAGGVGVSFSNCQPLSFPTKAADSVVGQEESPVCEENCCFLVLSRYVDAR